MSRPGTSKRSHREQDLKKCPASENSPECLLRLPLGETIAKYRGSTAAATY